MTTAKNEGKVREYAQRVGYGLVRCGKTGKPKIDNTSDLHPMHMMMMSAQERADTGQHADCWARDADGFKPITKTEPGQYRADEALRAVSQVFDVHTGNVWRLDKRGDVARGNSIVIENEVIK
ncbi:MULTISPECIES: hypothetical protein [unclassified Mameliella]|uniref:hypothetical protein n=1 Tax=unclassified Mameliella TaxID=2630630 RepID=UPI00273FE7AA|nr:MULTISPECIES: hypothetical protein [unclassified Mameliella]